MSSIPKSEELTIEEILEQIRAQAAAAPPFAATQAAQQRSPQVLDHTDANQQGAAADRTSPAADVPLHQTRTVESGAAGSHVAAPRREPVAEVEWEDPLAVGPIANDDAADLPALLKRPAVPPAPPAASARVHAFPRPKSNRLTDALRKVRTPAPPAPVTAPVAPAIPAAHERPMRRQMTSFLDTRFKKLSDRQAPAALPAPPPPDTATDPLAGVPMTTEQSAALQQALERLQAVGPESLARTRADAENLLRPMLQQWLLENMPRLIEKALTMELQENVAKTANKRTV